MNIKTGLSLCVLLMSSWLMAVVVTGGPAKPDPAAAIEAEVKAVVEKVESGRRQLPVKSYTGTIQQVLTARIADVNAVHSNIDLAKVKISQAVTITKRPVSLRDKLCKVIAEKSQQKLLEKKLHNADFLKAVDSITSDPNNMTDPNDPNEIASMMEFYGICAEIVESEGGV
jgi:hypothetical protein